MIPLAEVLMLPGPTGGALHIESADFSLARLRSHGAIVLAKCIAHTSWRSIELRQICLLPPAQAGIMHLICFTACMLNPNPHALVPAL